MSTVAWALVAISMLVASVALAIARRARTAEAEAREALTVGLNQHRRRDRERAAEDERRRIYRDLHDDIGAKLLSLVHTLPDPEHQDLVRAVLQDLRDVVSRASHAAGTLLEVLAQIRDETEQRLETLHAELTWEQDRALPDPDLDEGQALHLFRIVREAVTNSIRHAHVKRLRIRVKQAGPNLLLDVTDDGAGPTGVKPQEGHGTAGMRQRAAELKGSIHWDPGTEGGTKVVLSFPLPVDDAGAARPPPTGG